MANLTAIYNALPSISEANLNFTNREEVFTKLAPFIEKHDYAYGVCLVHAHTKLEAGEVMISTDDCVTEPVSSPTKPYYPERWLATGEPYEFTYKPTVEPSPEALAEFRQIVGPESPLGLFFVDKNAYTIRTETTEGRKSITSSGPPSAELLASDVKSVDSAWLPGKGTLAAFVCIICINACC
ncbi:hypothetical protein K439DRAFT_1636290 [Ramaria rubella]|nr:hypothetical protein K439DRAFT_1636290 [Ramaria rubella]